MLQVLEKLPAWKEAHSLFRTEQFSYGQLVPHEWFWSAFDLSAPGNETPWRIAKEVNFAYMANMEKLKEVLLHEDLLYLDNQFSAGYRIVRPSEQTATAMAKGWSRIQRAIAVTARAVGNIRVDELTDQQRRENLDARAKISSVAGLTRRIAQPF